MRLIPAINWEMGSELFYSELDALAYFNYTVIFPFLHFVEVSSQVDLLEIMPKFYNDLLEKKTDTLQKFIVANQGYWTNKPVGKTHLVDLMCLEAAKGVLLQCGREYGFPDSNNPERRATDLSTLSKPQLEGLPTNNLATERQPNSFWPSLIIVHRSQQNAEISGSKLNLSATIWCSTKVIKDWLNHPVKS